MGIAQLSNRLLMAPDGLTFQQGKQGMVGVAYVRTPLGEVAANDTMRNFWTVLVDTENFAGPLAYSKGSKKMDLGQRSAHGKFPPGGATPRNVQA